MQPSLFDRPSLIEQRDRAIAQVAQHAEEHRPNFSADARAFVLAYLGSHGPTSGEVLTEQCKAAGIVPHCDKAFGGVYQGLARRRQIVKVGSAPRLKGHLTAGASVWALGVNA